MMLRRLLPFTAVLLTAAMASAQPPLPFPPQAPDAKQAAQERAQAELDAPKLAAVLGLEPGMTVADVGAGFGAMTVVLAHRDKTGKFIATDIAERQLSVIRDYVKREGLENVTVLQSGAASANLPDACCDAIFLRNLSTTTSPTSRRSTAASSRHSSPAAGWRSSTLLQDAGSALPQGVPANREGHGVRAAIVIEEMKAAGFTVEQTIDPWPPGDKTPRICCCSQAVKAAMRATDSSSR